MASEMYQKCELGRFDWFWKIKKSSQKDDRFKCYKRVCKRNALLNREGISNFTLATELAHRPRQKQLIVSANAIHATA